MAAAVLNCSLPINCSLRSRDARWNPAPSSLPVKRDQRNRQMRYALHIQLLQSPEASIKSRRSRWKPPSSSHLVKRHMPRSSLLTRDAFHHLLLQIGGARSAMLNCSLPINCSLRSRDARWNPAPSSLPVKRDQRNRQMRYALHIQLLQSPEASIKSRRSRWKPPSSSHLVKRHMPRSSLLTRDAFHHLLLQIGGARSATLNCSLPMNCSLRSRDARGSDSACVRFPAPARRRTPKA